MSILGTLQLLLLAGVAVAAIAGLVVSAALPLVLRYTSTAAPASRHRALALTGLSPVSLALVALGSLAWPSVRALAGPEHDHCLLHEHGHGHLCFVHLTAGSSGWAGWAGWAVVVGVAAWIGSKAFTGAGAAVAASRLLEGLRRSAREDAGCAAWVVPTASPLCLSAGVLRPRLLISEGLLATASAEQLQVMLAHEAAHLRRKDTLTRLLVRGASLPLLPPARRALLAALELSAERACDEEAAHRVGDRLRVAETILAMERLMVSGHAPCAPLASAFVTSTVPERVEAMLLPPRDAGAFLPIGAAFALAVAGLLLVSEPLHHVTESALAFLLH